MSDQANSSVNSALTPEELRQRMLDQINASKSVVEELSDEELEEVAGGRNIRGYLISAAGGLFSPSLVGGLFGGHGSSGGSTSGGSTSGGSTPGN